MCKLKSVIECFIIISLQILCAPFVEANDIKCENYRANVMNLDVACNPWGIDDFSLHNHVYADCNISVIGDFDYFEERANMQNTEYASFGKNSFQKKNNSMKSHDIIEQDEGLKSESADIKQTNVPLKPIISDLTLCYDGYDYMQHCLVEPRFSCKVYAQYAEKISLLSTPTNMSSIPKDVFF